ncbi:unnamed protein product, partial [Prorocentrum cordatum]
MACTVYYGKRENLEESVEENEGLSADAGGTTWQESEDAQHEMIEEVRSEKDVFGGAQMELEGIDIDVNGIMHEPAQEKYGVKPNQITIPNERWPGDAIPDGDAALFLQRYVVLVSHVALIMILDLVAAWFLIEMLAFEVPPQRKAAPREPAEGLADGLDMNQRYEKDVTQSELEGFVNPTMLEKHQLADMLYDKLVSMAREGAETPHAGLEDWASDILDSALQAWEDIGVVDRTDDVRLVIDVDGLRRLRGQ